MTVCLQVFSPNPLQGMPYVSEPMCVQVEVIQQLAEGSEARLNWRPPPTALSPIHLRNIQAIYGELAAVRDQERMRGMSSMKWLPCLPCHFSLHAFCLSCGSRVQKLLLPCW